MISIFKRTVILFSCFILINCTSLNTKKSPSGILGNLLIFSETMPGNPPARVKIFVNDSFMRISNDNSPNDYLLFDRKKKIINNIVSESKTIFVIKHQAVDVKPPIEIKYEYIKNESNAVIKKRNGMKAFHYKFNANGSDCYNVVVVENYMLDALQAFKEFRQVLAGEHAKTMRPIPGEQYDACDLALNIFEATRHLQYGFPVREWDKKGYQRFLTDVKADIFVPEEWLIIPGDYKPYSVNK